MERFTISLDENLAIAFDELIKDRGYTTRSEAVRDLLRDRLQRRSERAVSSGYCVASLSYVYDHGERELAERLAAIQHAHHDLAVAIMQSPLDHQQRLECVMLKGPAKAIRQLADAIIAERGVRHGLLNAVSVELDKPHSHGGASHRHHKPRH